MARLWLPRRRGWSPLALGLSMGLHALLLFGRIRGFIPPRPPVDSEQVVLVPLAGPDREFPMVFRETPPVRSEPLPVRRRPSITAVLPEQPPMVRQTEEIDLRGPRLRQADTASAALPQVFGGGLRPARGEGRLWVAPLPMEPQELAQRLSRSHVELVDSAVTAIIQAYIDSVVATPTESARLPEWTTRIAGAKVGIDQKFIYLGPIKIPSMLLALLNIPAAQVDLNQARQVRAMQADLAQAARRAQTMADFRRAVQELRAERERQRKFERNSRQNPNDTTSRRP